MSFLFNFETTDNDHTDSDEGRFQNNGCVNSLKEKKSAFTTPDNAPLEAKEIQDLLIGDHLNKISLKNITLGDVCLKVVDTSAMEEQLLADHGANPAVARLSGQLSEALASHNDLVAGVYEGGLKMWECGMDLVQFLSSAEAGVEILGKRILELGCGAGLPGVYCCCHGAQLVDFQDYNEEVLRLLTHPNVLNNQQLNSTTACQYFSGDWSSFCRLAIEKRLKYDLILTAETIYSCDSYPKLHDVFEAVLAEEGVIFIAAKVYYFGVGGSIDEFEKFVRSRKYFSFDTVHSLGKGVPRRIVKLQRLNSKEKMSKTANSLHDEQHNVNKYG